MIPRRRFLQYSAASLAAIPASRELSWRPALATGDRHFEVVDVRRTTVKLEFREVPRRSMDRELPHWRLLELCDVTLKSGHVGTGETLLYYTWGVPSDAAVASVLGRNAVDRMWDDSLGAGLQMALFDAVGRAAEVPVHALLGDQVHQTTPLSWWNIDTPAADMASECKTALEQGYRSYKTKGRPWFDIDQQLKMSSAVVPETFKIDMDFNDTLRTAERGLPILQRLAKYPQTDIFESPIPQSDIAGNQRIVAATDVHVAMHFGQPSPAQVVQSNCCDGFVVGGGATRISSAARFCEQVEIPFWLQLVGAGLTAAYSLHFGAVCRQARWPAVNCHQLFEHDLLSEPLVVRDGVAHVPDRPGIGWEVDRDRVERLKVDKPAARPEPQRLIETSWPSGKRIYTANNGQVNFMLTAANAEKYPYYEPGADTRLVPRDSIPDWQQWYERARAAGPLER
jgi:galactonate dehydratase